MHSWLTLARFMNQAARKLSTVRVAKTRRGKRASLSVSCLLCLSFCGVRYRQILPDVVHLRLSFPITQTSAKTPPWPQPLQRVMSLCERRRHVKTSVCIFLVVQRSYTAPQPSQQSSVSTKTILIRTKATQHNVRDTACGQAKIWSAARYRQTHDAEEARCWACDPLPVSLQSCMSDISCMLRVRLLACSLQSNLVRLHAWLKDWPAYRFAPSYRD